ncbi:unnamed protein product, partial [Didymodactylos carnosus]
MFYDATKICRSLARWTTMRSDTESASDPGQSLAHSSVPKDNAR